MANSIGRSLVIGLAANTKNFGKDLKKAESDLTKFKNGVKKIGMAVTAGFAAMGAAAFAFGKDAIDTASDFNETMSKTNVIFGKSAQSIHDWAATSAKALGQSRIEAEGAASNFAIFGKSAGLTDKNLTKFAKKLVRTSADMASFANTSPAEAIDALGAALRGESEPIRKYGVLLDAQTLMNRAAMMGMKNLGKTLTPQQRILAAYNEILAQLGSKGSKTLGDFARTSQGAANQQRILNAEFTNAKIKLGEQLLPIYTKALHWLSDRGVKYLQSFIGVFTGDKSLKSALKDGTDGAYKFGQQVKGVIGWIIKHKDSLIRFAEAMAGIWAISKVVAGAKVLIGTISVVSKAFIGLRNAAAAAAAAEQAALGGGVIAGVKRLAGRALLGVTSAGSLFAGTVAVGAYGGYKMNEAAQTPTNVVRAGLLSRAQSLGMLPQTAARKKEIANLNKAATAVFNISGALDPKETARQIQKILQQYGLNTGTVQTTGRATP